MNIIANENGDRNVFLIHGHKGNEGKSWMQSYIEEYYGHVLVTWHEIRNKLYNIKYILSKRPLQTKDIILFNDTRSSDIHETNYSILYYMMVLLAVKIMSIYRISKHPILFLYFETIYQIRRILEKTTGEFKASEKVSLL